MNRSGMNCWGLMPLRPPWGRKRKHVNCVCGGGALRVQVSRV